MYDSLLWGKRHSTQYNTGDDDLHILHDGIPTPTQYHKVISDPIVDSVCYKPSECCNEQVDRLNAMNDWNRI